MFDEAQVQQQTDALLAAQNALAAAAEAQPAPPPAPGPMRWNNNSSGFVLRRMA